MQTDQKKVQFVIIGALAVGLSSIGLNSEAAVSKKPTVSIPETSAAKISKKTGAEQLQEVHSRVTKRLRFGVGISQASSLEGASVVSNGQTIASLDLSSGSVAALDIKWAQSLYQGPGLTKFNWYTSLTVERERSIGWASGKTLLGANNGQAFSLKFDSVKPTYQSNILSAGIEWTPKEILYFPMGLTLPVLTRSSVANGTFNLDPKIGVQIGIGGRLNEKFELELVYRRVSYGIDIKEKGNQTDSFTGTVLSSGTNLTARYVF